MTPEILSPPTRDPEAFTEARPAVDRLCALYEEATSFLTARFDAALRGDLPAARIRAFYPEIRLVTTSHAKIDSRLSFGHVPDPGTYATTITRPDLFRGYLEQQIGLLLENHGVPVTVGPS